MDVDEIQYISGNISGYISKPVLYLFYVMKLKDNPSYKKTTLKYFFENELSNIKSLNEEHIIEKFIEYSKTITNVSERCKLLIFINKFNKIYNNILNIETYPEFIYTPYNITLSNDFPDKSIVWDINKISPTLCGMFFENMVANILNINDECCDLLKLFNSDDSNIQYNSIQRMLKLYYLKNDNVIINDDIIYVDNDSLNKQHFKTIFHYLLFCSLLHFCKYDLNGIDYENSIDIIKYIETNENDLIKYQNDLKNTVFIKKFLNETNIKHGIYKNINTIKGELDFISLEYITDIKVYKTETIEEWFVQLYLYKQLMNFQGKLRILNLYTNKYYVFEQKCF